MTVDLLTRLQSAGEGENLDWLVMEQSLNRLDDDITRTIWAASIPHWFDSAFLSSLLDNGTTTLTADGMNSITSLSFVEAFPELGFNIHEHSRRLMLNHLWKTNDRRFREVSQRAQAHCSGQNQDEPAWRIETIYHSLTADPVLGVELLKRQVNQWQREHYDDRVEILARAALEVAEAGRVPADVAEIIEFTHASIGLLYGRKEINERTDIGLVRHFLAGEPQAVTTIDGWIARAAWPYKRRLSHRWDDVLQEVRLEVIRLLGKGRFEGQSSLRTYLWRVVSHACMDQLTRDTKVRLRDSTIDPASPDSVVRRYVNQETDEIDSLESRDILRQILDDTPRDCRELWRLIAMGHTYRELSSRLGITEGLLRVRVLRCREKAVAVRERLLRHRRGAEPSDETDRE